MGAVAEPDREFVLSWAQEVSGLLVDVGCGPGHWTGYLCEHDINVSGIDPVPEFLTHARKSYPGVAFREGAADRLGTAGETLGGVLAWYSLIHCTPEQVSAALADFARGLQPGGGLLLGFFEGPVFEPFDHAVTTAYKWPIGVLTSLIENAGFTITSTHTRTDPDARPHGAIIAARNPG